MVTKCGSTEQKTKDSITFPLFKYYHIFFSFSNTFSSGLFLLTHSFWPTFSPPFLLNSACMAKLPIYLLYLPPFQRYGFTREMNLLWFLFGHRYICSFLSSVPAEIQAGLNSFNFLCQYQFSVSLFALMNSLPLVFGNIPWKFWKFFGNHHVQTQVHLYIYKFIYIQYIYRLPIKSEHI